MSEEPESLMKQKEDQDALKIFFLKDRLVWMAIADLSDLKHNILQKKEVKKKGQERTNKIGFKQT